MYSIIVYFFDFWWGHQYLKKNLSGVPFRLFFVYFSTQVTSGVLGVSGFHSHLKKNKRYKF